MANGSGLGVTKYQPAPPGARPGSKAGAPGTTNYVPPNPVVPSAPEVDVASAVADAVAGLDFGGGIDWGSLISSGGGGGAPASYYDALAKARTLESQVASDKLGFEEAKYQTELDKYNLELARKAAGTQAAKDYYQQQLAGVEGGLIPEALGKTLEEQRKAREDFANTTYQNLLDRLGTSYTQAGNLTNEGFAALQAYLQNAPASPYTTAPRAVATPAANDIAQYMASRGVEAGRVEPGLLAAQAAAQGGAANYNNLLNVLAASSAQAQQSRLNEQMMAQRLAQATLATQRAAQEGALNQAQLAQLNAIQEQYNASRLQLQRDSIARENALRDAIASLEASGYGQLPTTDETTTGGGTTGGGTTGGGVEPGTGAVQQTAVQALAAKLPGIRNESLATKIASFVAQNPNASAAAVKKAFPKLGANIG